MAMQIFDLGVDETKLRRPRSGFPSSSSSTSLEKMKFSVHLNGVEGLFLENEVAGMDHQLANDANMSHLLAKDDQGEFLRGNEEQILTHAEIGHLPRGKYLSTKMWTSLSERMELARTARTACR